MKKFDDSDMKIVGEMPDKSQLTKEEAKQTAVLLKQEKENGNIERARQFGSTIAEKVVSKSSIDENHPCAHHMKILTAFAGEVSFQGLLPNNLLALTALSVYNEALRHQAQQFYEELQESGAFSFYYLCLRDSLARKSEIKWDDDILASRVGETFAVLCGKADDGQTIAKGTEVYSNFVKQIKELYEKIDFII